MDLKNDGKVSFRVSKDERIFIESFANKMGFKSLSEFLRNVVFTKLLEIKDNNDLSKIRDNTIITATLCKKIANKTIGEEETTKIIDSMKKQIEEKYGNAI
jgi:hypothetical protein